jgi:hypothetical protein
MEPAARYFDLLEPTLIRRHLDSMVADLRAARHGRVLRGRSPWSDEVCGLAETARRKS